MRKIIAIAIATLFVLAPIATVAGELSAEARAVAQAVADLPEGYGDASPTVPELEETIQTATLWKLLISGWTNNARITNMRSRSRKR